MENIRQWGIIYFMNKKIWQTVVETPEFIKQASTCLDEASKKAFIDYIAKYPLAGDLMIGTGGARKIRWMREGQGKRGGVRIIYYYHDNQMPIFLFTVYPKNEKDNLTDKEKKTLDKIIKMIIETYER